MSSTSALEFIQKLTIKAYELGFTHISSSSIDLSKASIHFNQWIQQNFHGQMHYMEKHGDKRYRPEKLVPDTVSILTVRLPYFNPNIEPFQILNTPDAAYIAQYALGRDYHRVMRKNLTLLGKWLQGEIPHLQFRAFVDSAPVLERALSQQSGLGFFGKNTMLIDPDEGSYFFLGELYINQSITIPNTPIENHCGRCQKCINICPTQAIIAPYILDARKCISYLTIEYYGAFPLMLRRAIGNRIFGCDDCQAICPWNRFAKPMTVPDFQPRYDLDKQSLLMLFNWDEETFLKRTEGSPIRRLGHTRFIRNIAIGLGNAPYHPNIIIALQKKVSTDPFVQEHIQWALNEQLLKRVEGD